MLFLVACGRPPTGSPLQLRWPTAEQRIRTAWRASIVRWSVDLFADGSVGRRQSGKGAFPAEVHWDGEKAPTKIRIELWLADARRPEVAWPTMVGEGNPVASVSLRLLDSRWAIAP